MLLSQAGTGIAELITIEIARQGKIKVEEARTKIYLADSKVLFVLKHPSPLQLKCVQGK